MTYVLWVQNYFTQLLSRRIFWRVGGIWGGRAGDEDEVLLLMTKIEISVSIAAIVETGGLDECGSVCRHRHTLLVKPCRLCSRGILGMRICS